ncbi:DUF4340 domain-containing protein, partial [uncultured Treponema sp.]
NPVKTLAIQESPDFIEISSPSSKTTLSLDGTVWYVGNDSFQADKSSVDMILNAVKEIKVLDTVGKLGSDDFNARYDLNDEKAYTITAKKGDAVIRTIRLGKTSSTGSQTYLAADKSKDIYLVSGNLQSVFNKTEDSLKSKIVYSVSAASITAVNSTVGKASFRIERDTSEETAGWKLTGASGTEIDAGKADAWVSQLASCTASGWEDDAKRLPDEKTASVEITTAEGTITVDIFKENDTTYICASNKTPHRFTLSETSAAKFKKTAGDLKK